MINNCCSYIKCEYKNQNKQINFFLHLQFYFTQMGSATFIFPLSIPNQNLHLLPMPLYNFLRLLLLWPTPCWFSSTLISPLCSWLYLPCHYFVPPNRPVLFYLILSAMPITHKLPLMYSSLILFHLVTRHIHLCGLISAIIIIISIHLLLTSQWLYKTPF